MTTSRPAVSAPDTEPNSRVWDMLKFWGLPILLVLISALFKTMPYLINRFGWDLAANDEYGWIWGFSPLLPLAVVLGATRSPRTAVLLASAAWLLGDLGIWAASGVFEYAFYRGQPLVFICMWLVVFSGFGGTKWTSPESPKSWRMTVNTGSGLVGALLFFIVSNFLVWVFASEMAYARTLGGLLECYGLAVPFHRNDFLSMLIFVPVLTSIMPVRSAQPATVNQEVLVGAKN